MKNIRNLISNQTRMDAIITCGLEFGTEVWHKRCTGDTTASAMQLLAHAMKKQGRAVDASNYTDKADSLEAHAVLEVAESLVQKLGLLGFKFSKHDGTVICNVFEPA